MLSLDFTKGGPEITAALEKRLQEQADDPVALTHLAAIYETQGLREKAAELYEQVLRLNSSNPKSLINLARLYADHLNNQPKALELAKSAYKLAPNDVDIAHVLGRLVFANGQYKWALSLLQQGDARKSADADLLYNLALALYSMGQPAEAVGTMHDALMSNPNFAQAQEANQFMELVSLADDPAKAAESESLIQKTLKTDAANVPALMASAAIAQQKGNLPAAISALEQALQRYPDFTPAIKKLAANYFSTPGKEQRAYELAVKAREASPADAGIARLLGMISYQRGDFSSAVRLLKQGLANENPADARPYYYLGMAQFKLKSLSESKTSLQQAMSKNLEGPLADEARKTLALIK
ncbi:MAG: tetratricopeptide repeat protein [Verrucomicrobiota bacterium]